jgi:hypothetical protein
MKHEPLSSIIQGGAKRRMGIGYAGSEQTVNMVYNEFPKCNMLCARISDAPAGY